MELKVWVEGIQRIVCGVNEKTTCQDVVYALAHATGKTGRFTLIERWRNSERLLAPNEQPLKVLLKWGEHSNDVQFILHWAPLELPSAKTPGAKQFDSDSSFAKNNPSLVSPSGTLSKNGVSSKSKVSNPVASDTSSMKRKDPSNSVGVVRGIPQRTNDIIANLSHGGADSPSESSKMGNLSSATKNVNFGHDLSDSDGSPGKKLKDFHVSSPPPYREPPNPSRTIAHSPIGVSATAKGLPPYREPPPPNLNMQHQGSRNTSSASLQSSHKQSSHMNSASPLFNASVNHNVGNVSTTSSVSPMDTSSGSKPFTSSSDSVQKFSHEASSLSSKDSKVSVKDYSITNGDGSSNVNGMMPKKCPSPISTANPQYQELVHLINVQREKLTAQHAEMTQFDAEIMFWEGKAKEQQRHLDFITKEISRLELYSAQQESQVLSLMHLEEENELVKQESESLKSEIELLREEFEKCEKELNGYKSKIGHLSTELQAHRNNMKQRQEEWMRREADTLAEIDILKQELELARRETEAVTDLSGNLDMEVNSLEMDLAGKKKQMERLLNAMKEANLQSLTIQPPEEVADSGAHHRSGSTRRMIGSPRQLENAAPTSKNPHGVWV